MKRVLVLGPGGSGKSTLARRLAEATGLPLHELDRIYWGPDLRPLPPAEWEARQAPLVQADGWILDGDLGPYDGLEVRLARADTVVLLDLARWRCVWRTLRRSRERIDFWRWLWHWRRVSRPVLLTAVAAHPAVRLHVLRTPREVTAFVAGLSRVPGSDGVIGQATPDQAQ